MMSLIKFNNLPNIEEFNTEKLEKVVHQVIRVDKLAGDHFNLFPDMKHM